MIFNRLRSRMIVHIVAIVSCVTIVSFYAAYRLHEKTVTRHLEDDATVMSELVYRMLPSYMERNEQPVLHQLLPELARLRHIEAVHILDRQGRVIFSSDRKRERTDVVAPHLLNFMKTGGDANTFKFNEGDHVSYVSLRKIYNEPRCYGCHDSKRSVNGVLMSEVTATMSFSILQDYLGGIVSIAVGVILLLSFATGLLFVESVEQPIHKMQTMIKSLEFGNFSARIDHVAPDELGQLAQGLNTMALKLEQARKHFVERHEDELRQSESLAKFGELAARMAHEIKNPISGIVFATNSILRETPHDDSMHEIFEEMLSQANHVEENLEALLNFARHQRLECFPTNINKIIERILLFVQRQNDMKEIQVESRLQADLPDVLVDPKQIEQVVMNLVLNAAQAMPGGGRLVVTTETDASQEHVLLSVTDTGSGVPQEIRDQIFQPFFTTRPTGVGLGLALCRETVQRHSGTISFESGNNGGTTFVVKLPVGSLEELTIV